MFSYKVVLVGDFGTGKTSLIRRYVDNSFSEDYISSIGVSISKKNISTSNNETTMMIWDIEGKTDLKPIFKQYLLGSKGFIIVADLSREKTIESIKEHIKLCEEISTELPIFIALNKADIKSVDYDETKLRNLSSSIVNIYTTSAKSGNSVEDLFIELNDSVIERNN